MVISISFSTDEIYKIQKNLDDYFKIKNFYYKDFNVGILQEKCPYVVIFNCKYFSENRSELFEEIIEKCPGIPVVCFTSEKGDSFDAYKNVTVVPKNDYELLIKRLKEIISGEPDWDETINKMKEYIIDNITKVTSVKQVIDKFGTDHRRLSSEFNYKTGMSIREFLVETRFNLLMDILKNTEEATKYYNIARQCGLKDESSLSHFVKNKTGKTVIEFHKELLKL